MRADLQADVTEKGLQQAVLDLAALHGWLSYHTHDSRGSNHGFPDLVLVHVDPGASGGQIVYAELKSTTGKLTIGQQLWLQALSAAGAEVHVWRPADWDQIVARLKKRTS